MNCFEIDLNHMLKVTMLNKTLLTPPRQHITRYTDEYILYVVLSGRLCLEQNGERLELFPGDIYLFDKGEFQKPLECTECEFYFLHFETDSIRRLDMTDDAYCSAVKKKNADFLTANIYGSESYNHMNVFLKQKIHISDKNRFDYLINMLRNNFISYGYNTPEWRLNISAASAGLLLKLEEISFESFDAGYYKKSDKVYNAFLKIVNYIEEHYKENFGRRDIEKDLLINYDYANRILKKHIGFSIIKYRNKLRINTAKTLIASKSMEQIAVEVGFSDRYYFSRCFKKFEGISPEQYKLAKMSHTSTSDDFRL